MSDFTSKSATVSTTGLATSGGGFPAAGDGYAGRAFRGRPGFVEQFAGIIRKGPRSPGLGDNYTDARYWVDRAVPANGADATGVASAEVDRLPGVDECVTATNLAEITAKTHLLASGTLVQVYTLVSRGSSGGKMYVFDQTPQVAVVVKISANAGAGEYNGQTMDGTSTASSGDGLAMPVGLAAGNDALILNVEESGESGHRLATGSYAVGVIRGMTTDTPPKRIVFIRGGVGRTDGASSVGSDSDSSETADGSSWSRATDATPVEVYVVSRVVYNPGGDQAIYQFLRSLSFDARGLLFAISGEIRVTVDGTEPCP